MSDDKNSNTEETKVKRTTKPKQPVVEVKVAALESIGYDDVKKECQLWESEYQNFLEAIAVEEPTKLTEGELLVKYPTLKFLKAMTEEVNQEWRAERYVTLVKEVLTDKQVRDYYEFVRVGKLMSSAWEQAAKELDEHLMHKYQLDSKDVGGAVLEEDKEYITGKFDA